MGKSVVTALWDQAPYRVWSVMGQFPSLTGLAPSVRRGCRTMPCFGETGRVRACATEWRHIADLPLDRAPWAHQSQVYPRDRQRPLGTRPTQGARSKWAPLAVRLTSLAIHLPPWAQRRFPHSAAASAPFTWVTPGPVHVSQGKVPSFCQPSG